MRLYRLCNLWSVMLLLTVQFINGSAAATYQGYVGEATTEVLNLASSTSYNCTYILPNPLPPYAIGSDVTYSFINGGVVDISTNGTYVIDVLCYAPVPVLGTLFGFGTANADTMEDSSPVSSYYQSEKNIFSFYNSVKAGYTQDFTIYVSNSPQWDTGWAKMLVSQFITKYENGDFGADIQAQRDRTILSPVIGNDEIHGGDGNDVLETRGGSDKIYGEAGNDILSGNREDWNYSVLVGDSNVDPSWNAATLYGGPGDDVFYVRDPKDKYIEYPGEGFDIAFCGFYFDATTPDYVMGKGGYKFSYDTDIEVIAGNCDVLPPNFTGRYFPNLYMQPFEVIALNGKGTSLSDAIYYYEAGLTFDAGGGDDLLVTGPGNDSLTAGTGNDLVSSGDGTDTVFAGDGSDLIVDSATIIAAALAPLQSSTTQVVASAIADDVYDGGAGADTVKYQVSRKNATITIQSDGSVKVQIGTLFDVLKNIETVEFSDTSVKFGSLVADTMNGTKFDDELYGLAGNDTLKGNAGDDVIYGGAGASDTLVLSGNLATYSVFYNATTKTFNAIDSVAGRDGADRGSGIEYLKFADQTVAASTFTAQVYTGTVSAETLNGSSGKDQISGLDGDDILNGNGGDDFIDGGLGSDTMAGGSGNDIYVVDNASDIVSEASNSGIDTVLTTLSSYTLPANVENVIYIGTESFTGSGNALANTIAGGPGADNLNGGVGNDSLAGGAGNDKYTFNSAGDLAIEDPSNGTDSVFSSISIAALGANIENLTLTGSASLSGTGNALNNTITGNSGANILNGGDGNDNLDGGAGVDSMIGGLGDDIYTVDNAGDVVTENTGTGTDTLNASISISLLTTNVENLTLLGSADIIGTGNSLNNKITGNAGANILSGGDGNDTLDGGAGDDTFYGNTNVTVGTDIDTVSFASSDTSISFNLSLTTRQTTGGAGSDMIPNGSIENLIGGSAADVLTGTSGANQIQGKSGDDAIFGLAGADVLIGNAGRDTIDCGSESTNKIDTVKYLAIDDSPVGATRDQLVNCKAGDLIDLSLLDANTALAADQAFLFKNSTATANSVWYTISGSDIVVKGDVTGDTTPDFEILVKGRASMAASDFLL